MSNDSRGDDPVVARIARILEAKRRDNADVLSALRVAEDAWEELGKEVDTAIGDEFDLVNAEQQAVQAARGRLVEPEFEPSEQHFVVVGRVFERDSQTGLPQVLVRITRERSDAAGPVAEVVTDAGGAFRALLAVADGGPNAAASLRLEALTSTGGRPLAVVRRDVRLEAGGVERVDMPVARTRGIADRVTAGEAAGESIDEAIAAIELRLDSMRAAHTATTRFSELTRDGLRELSDALAVDPPPVTPAVPLDATEPFALVDGPPPSPTQPEPKPPQPQPEPPQPEPKPPPVPPSTPLEDLRGIGPQLAQRLREAGIADVEALVDADFDTLVEVAR